MFEDGWCDIVPDENPNQFINKGFSAHEDQELNIEQECSYAVVAD